MQICSFFDNIKTEIHSDSWKFWILDASLIRHYIIVNTLCICFTMSPFSHNAVCYDLHLIKEGPILKCWAILFNKLGSSRIERDKNTGKSWQ